ncbi:MAG: DUF4177 domain-containing protein [Bacteroidota bacterium]
MKYEYKIIKVNVAHLQKDRFQLELDKKFNHWGNLGWDLVKFEPILENSVSFFSGSYTKEFIVVFKRLVS